MTALEHVARFTYQCGEVSEDNFVELRFSQVHKPKQPSIDTLTYCQIPFSHGGICRMHSKHNSLGVTLEI